jgi:hypothetical protein
LLPGRQQGEVRPRFLQQVFMKFVGHAIEGASAVEALVEIYGNDFSDMADFEKRFSRFTRR